MIFLGHSQPLRGGGGGGGGGGYGGGHVPPRPPLRSGTDSLMFFIAYAFKDKGGGGGGGYGGMGGGTCPPGHPLGPALIPLCSLLHMLSRTSACVCRMSENCKSLVLQDKCNIGIFL